VAYARAGVAQRIGIAGHDVLRSIEHASGDFGGDVVGVESVANPRRDADHFTEHCGHVLVDRSCGPGGGLTDGSECDGAGLLS
jgi:hypothetical protein